MRILNQVNTQKSLLEMAADTNTSKPTTPAAKISVLPRRNKFISAHSVM